MQDIADLLKSACLMWSPKGYSHMNGLDREDRCLPYGSKSQNLLSGVQDQNLNIKDGEVSFGSHAKELKPKTSSYCFGGLKPFNMYKRN